MLDVVLVAQLPTTNAATATALTTERVGRDRLHVALVRQHDDHFFVLDEIEGVEVTGVDRQLRLAIVGVVLADLAELVLDDTLQLLLTLQDRVELLDGRLELRELVAELLALELGEAAQLHVEDVVRLRLGELERSRLQPGASGVDVFG